MTDESNLILGARKYLTMYDESSWGVMPGSPQKFHIPVTDYSVKFVPVGRQSNPYLGGFQRMHNRHNYKGMPSGGMTVPLYGWYAPNMGTSVAQYFLDWAFGTLEGNLLPSKACEWAEGPDIANKRARGLRVNSATLSGSDDTGQISLVLELKGQDEDGISDGVDPIPTAATLPTNRYKLVDFEFHNDTTFYLGPNGNELMKPKSFQIQAQFGLKEEYNNQNRPDQMPRTQTVITAQFSFAKNSDTYDAIRRSPNETEYVGQILLKGLHMGTSPNNGTNWNQVQIDLPRCSYVSHDDQGGIQDLAFQQLSFVVLKPQNSSPSLLLTYSDIP
jgi:hypothetical protein